VRIVALHRDAVVVTSRIWQTTATALRAGEEAMLVDSPYFPDELELLPHALAEAGFRIDALLATHGDFDHLLGRAAYPQHALGVAESTAIRLRSDPGAAQRELRDADARFYVERERPLSLGSYQALPVPGKLELGDEELELHPAEGHTADGMAVFAPFCGVLCPGDYLSDVEIPAVQDLTAYRGTLARLAPLVERASSVVPGHGAPQPREDALRILEEDLAYLDALERGDERPRLPRGRGSSEQRRIHERNLAALGEAG
jgi:glyoxylase-like metal-dependent hydrolase (beta-lactamase superfamily II)